MKNWIFVIFLIAVFVFQSMQSIAHSHIADVVHSTSKLDSIESHCNNNISQNESQEIPTNGSNSSSQDSHQHTQSDCCSLHCGANHAAIVYSFKGVEFLIKTKFTLLSNSKHINFQNSIYRPPIV